MGNNNISFIPVSQVWVSCASMRLVDGPSVRATEDQEDYDNSEEPLYTDEEYAELEEAFQN